jgi:Epoxide hydrolase N terminus
MDTQARHAHAVTNYEEDRMSVMTSTTPATAPAIRPFTVDVPDDELVELRRRLATTRWPDKEPVGDRSQGVQLAKLQPLVEYWATEYDWLGARSFQSCSRHRPSKGSSAST